MRLGSQFVRDGQVVDVPVFKYRRIYIIYKTNNELLQFTALEVEL